MNEPDDSHRDLAKRLKELRLERGLSQEVVAARAGTSQPTWSRLETDGKVTVAQLLCLQQLFGFETVESFFGALPSQRFTGDAGDVESPSED